jgi:hypothetical protein
MVFVGLVLKSVGGRLISAEVLEGRFRVKVWEKISDREVLNVQADRFFYTISDVQK